MGFHEDVNTCLWNRNGIKRRSRSYDFKWKRRRLALDFRLKSLKAFENMPMQNTLGCGPSDIDFTVITYFKRASDKPARLLMMFLRRLKILSRKSEFQKQNVRIYWASAQFESEVYHNMKEEFDKLESSYRYRLQPKRVSWPFKVFCKN